MQRRCLSCHGPKTKTAGLDLSTRDGALKGGVSGAALKPGSPAESLLLSRVLKGQMPPAAPLPPAEKELTAAVDRGGAPWSACYLGTAGGSLIGGRCSRLKHKRAAEAVGLRIMGQVADRSMDLCAPASE